MFTSVYVDPATLETFAPCTSLSGGMQSYFAQLTDVSDPANPVVLDPSPITACNLRASFGKVESGHYYTGTVSAFDLPPCSNEVTTNCVGSVLTSVTPKWRLACGNADNVPLYDGGVRVYPDGGGPDDAGDASTTLQPPDPFEPTLSLLDVQVKLRGCRLVSAVPSTTTEVVVAPTADASGPSCGDGADQMKTWVISASDSSLDPITVECGKSATFSLTNVPDRLDFRVDAFAKDAVAGAPPSYGTSCTSLPVEGSSVVASCDGFAKQGALIIEPGPIFGAHCNETELVSYRADLVGVGSSATVSCKSTLRFDGLKQGLYSATVTATNAAGVSSIVAVCKGYVATGATTIASCEVASSTP